MEKNIRKNEKGYIALISAIITSLVLLGLSAELSSSSFALRFSSLDSEYKRESLGLAESCANIALLKLAQDPAYVPAVGGENVSVGGGSCTIAEVNGLDTEKTIDARANFKGAFSSVRIRANLLAISSDDEGPPIPNTLCADTVMMLDRTNSMSTTAKENEAAAAKALLDLYKNLSTPPQVGVGSFGGLDGSWAQVPTNPSGLLTDVYGVNSVSLAQGPQFPASATSPNQWTNPGSAFLNDALFATNSTNGQAQGYTDFNIAIPAGSSVDGIEVTVDGFLSSGPADTAEITLSWNNGSNWTSLKSVTFTTTESAQVVGSASNTWGRPWNIDELSDTNFRVRIKNKATTGIIMSLNYLAVKIYYTTPSTNLYKTVEAIIETGSSGTNLEAAINAGSDELNGPRHDPSLEKVLILISDGQVTQPANAVESALDAADVAKQNDIQIFTIFFGNDPDGTNILGHELVAALATGTESPPSHSGHNGSGHELGSKYNSSGENSDGDHMFIAPTSADLEGLFEQVALLVCPSAGEVNSGANVLINSWEEIP